MADASMTTLGPKRFAKVTTDDVPDGDHSCDSTSNICCVKHLSLAAADSLPKDIRNLSQQVVVSESPKQAEEKT